MRVFASLAAFVVVAWFFLGLATAQETMAPCLLVLDSDPPGVFLRFDDEESSVSTPAETLFTAGSHRLEASFDGYETLVHNLDLAPGDTLRLNFILLAEKPTQPAPEALGLSYQPVVPLVLEDQAQTVRRKYNLLAEVFAIIPLSHGIMVRAALGGGNDYASGELITVGLVLSVSSYFLGRHKASKNLKAIREQNSVLAAQNSEAQEHNKDVDRKLRQAYSEAIIAWQAEASWRGRVRVSR